LTRWHQLRAGHQIEDLFRATLTGLNGTSMPNTEMSAEDRWAMSAYLKSIQQEKKERQDQVVLVKRVEELPSSVDDEKWDALPSVTFPLVGQVVEKPRLLWPSVTEVFVKAAYDDESIVLLLAWHDPDASPGTNLTEFPPESDPITETFVTGDFPDQAAVQFPAGRHDGSERPFFLWGDSKREVNLWWWGSHLGDLVERNASGKAPTDQDEASQGLTGEVKFERGRYRMLVRRDLTTPDPHDVQFAPGEFVPIAFNVWQGSRGEIGRRRNISTWYLLVLEPPTGRTAYVAPFLAGGLTLTLLLFIVTRIYRTATRPAPRLYERLAPAVSVVAIGALVLYASVPGLYGFFTGTVTGDERARIEEGRDIEFRAIVRAAEKNFASYRWTDASRETVKLPIDRAMQQVLEEARAGAPSLVPAVGAHDQPTMPPPQPEPAEPAEP
jgi:DMSO reductase family type II enzyme heme b subunit